jgi:hypothetical protein
MFVGVLSKAVLLNNVGGACLSITVKAMSCFNTVIARVCNIVMKAGRGCYSPVAPVMRAASAYSFKNGFGHEVNMGNKSKSTKKQPFSIINRIVVFFMLFSRWRFTLPV